MVCASTSSIEAPRVRSCLVLQRQMFPCTVPQVPSMYVLGCIVSASVVTTSAMENESNKRKRKLLDILLSFYSAFSSHTNANTILALSSFIEIQYFRH